MADHSLKRTPFDIREYKKALRKRYRKVRTSMTTEERKERDTAIFHHLRSMPEYTAASVILCYVSMEEEIDTHSFIEKCIEDGKIVGAPYCISGSREMDFYQIHSFDDLVPRTFGVLEPVAETSIKIEDFSDALCILPGISFDKAGYRLGYGGGYYDRFLSQKYNGKATIGVCYKECTRPKLIHGRYDIPCKFVVTQHGVHRCGVPKQKGKKGRQKKKES